MVDDQAPIEQTHHPRSDSTTRKRKRLEEEQELQGETRARRSPKRHQRQAECDKSLGENMREAQQDLYTKQAGEVRK